MKGHCLQIESVKQNLEDVGCAPEVVEQCLTLLEKGKTDQLLRLLRTQRTNLLNGIHTEQKKLDCLDYLVYQMKKSEKENKSL